MLMVIGIIGFSRMHLSVFLGGRGVEKNTIRGAEKKLLVVPFITL